MILITKDDILHARVALRDEGKQLVLTNGVFDLLHVGHVRYLQAAAALGDVLWVAVNSDASVRILKGEMRPLLPWEERAELLNALTVVGAVLYFDERTADGIIRLVAPDIYAKGGDYTADTLPEMATVREVGAQAEFLPFVEGRSTTSIIERIIQQGGAEPNL
jgi:D-glycero-beta-D-manno-heptose 1-phosphate adenylyltransferase